MPLPASDRSRCLTVRQVAEALQISRQSVYNLIHTKQLKAVKVVGFYRVRGYELERFLDRMMTGE